MWCGILVGALFTMTQSPAAAPRENIPIAVVLPGETLRGTLVQMNATTVTFLRDGGRRTLPLDAVLKIETTRRDSPLDGAVIGGLIALAFGVIANATYAAESKGRGIVPITVLGAVAGGVYDAKRKSVVTLYERPSPPAQPPRSQLSFTIRF